MNFFDFHVHPTLKTLFGDKDHRLSPWENLDVRLIPDLLRWCTEFKYILRSQANLQQLIYNECRLVCIALYAPEHDIIDNQLILNNADTGLRAYLSRVKLDKILSNAITPYDLIVNDDLKTLFDPAQFQVADKKIVALAKATDYDEKKEDTLYAVFSVEGCHTLSKQPLSQIKSQEVIANLDDLRSRLTVLALNLTHMEQSPLCNHAFGMQFIPNDSFKPKGFGLSPEGGAIVKHCYQNKIMIDVKHMSVVARTALYEMRRSVTFLPINQPIICTHAGFTGISREKIFEYIYTFKNYADKPYVKLTMGKPAVNCTGPRPAFNTSSINLYDEDILEILRSDGMIGLSLDKRILGFADRGANENDYALEVEYISARETAAFFKNQTIGQAFKRGDCIENKEIDDVGPVNPRLGEYHLRHFMSHIVHLIKVCQSNNYDVSKALAQVCVGSDFDGMINPVWICDTIDHLAYFRKQFEKEFVRFCNACQVALPPGFKILSFAEDLFYKNGKDFVMARLALMNP
jgi:microsomal dipeptidase-like Zn-dependent dipeptidase